MRSGAGTADAAAYRPSLDVPAIASPKGGGAIRGIGEKFSANPATGTMSFTVPIAISPGRQSLTPSLDLNYGSGTGNGPFGIGWQLSVPQISRKTDKGLPLYEYDAESDVFVLSGSEDLVPARRPRAGGGDEPDCDTFGEYSITRYKPRVEGLFARIERWTHHSDGFV